MTATMIIGSSVSPAPVMAYPRTNVTAMKSSDTPYHLRKVAPASTTRGSLLKTAVSGAPAHQKTTVSATAIAPASATANHPARSARRGFPAPRFCPTIAPAAVPNPMLGPKTNICSRIPMPNPATGIVPNIATSRINRSCATFRRSIRPDAKTPILAMPATVSPSSFRCLKRR